MKKNRATSEPLDHVSLQSKHDCMFDFINFDNHIVCPWCYSMTTYSENHENCDVCGREIKEWDLETNPSNQ
jgi:rRNA maturation endonuclease Nob1